MLLSDDYCIPSFFLHSLFTFCDVGDPEVGKTSIFLRYTKNQFDYSYQPSVSVSIGNVVKHVNIPYETIVSVSLWDLPGREEMDLRRSYYKDVDAAIGEDHTL